MATRFLKPTEACSLRIEHHPGYVKVLSLKPRKAQLYFTNTPFPTCTESMARLLRPATTQKCLLFMLLLPLSLLSSVCTIDKCSAHRKKMEEIAEQEKELARIEAMENALDVTKQDNMGGFYR